jgi:hypothetical protein
MTDEQLHALLRLKRFEQPPEGYFDGLLRDIHRRQREELLRRPLWKISLERLQTFFGEHSMGAPAYAGAMAGVMLTGLLTITLIGPRAQNHEVAAATASKAAPTVAGEQPFSLHLDQRPETLLTQSKPAAPPEGLHFPRYIIDARPASYDASSISSF